MRLFTCLSLLCLFYSLGHGTKQTDIGYICMFELLLNILSGIPHEAPCFKEVPVDGFPSYYVIAGIFHRCYGQHEDERDGRGEPGQRGDLRDELSMERNAHI